MPHEWTSEMQGTLRVCARRKMPASDIASAMNERFKTALTSGAIIGRAYRTGVRLAPRGQQQKLCGAKISESNKAWAKANPEKVKARNAKISATMKEKRWTPTPYRYVPKYWDDNPKMDTMLREFAAKELFAAEITIEMNKVFGTELTKNSIVSRCRRRKINLQFKGKNEINGRRGAQIRWSRKTA